MSCKCFKRQDFKEERENDYRGTCAETSLLYNVFSSQLQIQSEVKGLEGFVKRAKYAYNWDFTSRLYLSGKISSKRTFKSLSLRGVVMAVVSRESLHLRSEKVFNRAGKGLIFIMNNNFGR